MLVALAATSVVTTSSYRPSVISAATTTSINRVGLMCTKDSTAGTTHTSTFDLTTAVGYVSLPDGNTTWTWGYSEIGKPFQHPGPVLCVNQGDAVTVHLTNALNTVKVPTSIMFPGQENVLANGAPVQPVLGTGGSVTSMVDTAANGGSVTYTFTATEPGTYLYESGTDPETQVRMGLFGALIVYPTAGPSHAYNSPESAFTPTEEFLVLLSEVDPYQHDAAETCWNTSGCTATTAGLASRFDINDYHPRYWLINGRGFPDSVADNKASWLPSQPYGALARVHPFNTDSGAGLNYHPLPALTRYLNVGTEDYPFHPHGNNGSIIGRDGAELRSSDGKDLSFEKFSINLGPGQTWDVLSKWFDAENYNPTTNKVEDIVKVPSIANQVFGMFYSGTPYLGVKGTLPPGTQSLNQCGEFYIIAHNHALYQITSWGVNMTGPITYMRVDPPFPNNCPL
jgi:FtsP/CotA-like multicopper oxidase with cupredoxin domain